MKRYCQYILAILVMLSFQSIVGAQPPAITGGGAIVEQADVTMDFKIADSDLKITDAMNLATHLRKMGRVPDRDWPMIKEALTGASNSVDLARHSHAKNPELAAEELRKVDMQLEGVNKMLTSPPAQREAMP